MKIKVQIEKESLARTRQTLKSVEEACGVSVEEAVEIIAFESAKKLAHRIHPWGFSRMDKFAGSIAKQVKRAVRNANITGGTESIQQAHQTRRNKRGQIPKSLQTHGQFKREPIDLAQANAFAEKKMRNAGMAKAGWVDAGQQIGIGPMESHPLISRHLRKGLGFCSKLGIRFTKKITLQNKVPYISRIQSNSVIANSLKQGLEQGYKVMDRMVKKRMREVQKAQGRYIRFQKASKKLHSGKYSI